MITAFSNAPDSAMQMVIDRPAEPARLAIIDTTEQYALRGGGQAMTAMPQ